MADFSKRAQDEILELIVTQAESFFPEENYTVDTSSLVGVILQVVAKLYNENAYYFDKRSAAAYLSRAELEQDIRSIAGNLGYSPGFKTGATVDVEFTASDTVTIPKGSQVNNSDNIVFSTLADLTLDSSNSFQAEQQCVHGSFEQLVRVGAGDATERYSFNRSDVLESHITVTRNGSSFTDFTMEYDEFDNNTLVMTGLNLNDVVVIDYFYGGGVLGNTVAAGTSSDDKVLNELDGTFDNSDNVTNIANAAVPTGGAEQPTIEEIAERIPEFIDSISVIMSKETPAGPLQKDATTSFVQDAFVKKGFETNGKPTAELVAFPSGSSIQPLSAAQRASLVEFLDLKASIASEWSIADAQGAPVELEIDVYLQNQSERKSKEQEIKTYLTDITTGLFRPGTYRFDAEYLISSFKDIADNVSGINKVDVKKLTKKPQSVVQKGVDRLVYANTHHGQTENAIYTLEEDVLDNLKVEYLIPFTPTNVTDDYIEDYNLDTTIHFESHESGTDLDPTATTFGPAFGEDASNDMHWFPGETSFHPGLVIEPYYVLKVEFDDTTSGDHRVSYYLATPDEAELQRFDIDLLSGYDIKNNEVDGNLAVAKNENIEFTLMQNIGVFLSGETTCEVFYDYEAGSSRQATHQDTNKLYITSAAGNFKPGTQYLIRLRTENVDIDLPTQYESLNKGFTSRWTQSVVAEDKVFVYVTPYNGDVAFKDEKEVFTLSNNNIKINFR